MRWSVANPTPSAGIWMADDLRPWGRTNASLRDDVDTTAPAHRLLSGTDDALIRRAAQGRRRVMDAELVARAQRGDAAAFALVAEGIADRSLAVARRILGDPGLAEDATQRALLRVWQDLPQLRDVECFDAWSYRILLRACYAEGRKQRRWAPNTLSIKEPRTDHDVGAILDRDQLERGLCRLSGNHREVVALHFFLDLTLDRVAEILGIPVGTARSRLHHAIRALRAALDADLRPAGFDLVPGR